MRMGRLFNIGYRLFCDIRLQFLTGLLFLISLGMSLCYSGMHLTGDDFWWHVKVGRWICEHHAVPKKGIFSWYALQENLDWFAHEWLSEVILYGMESIAGEYAYLLYILPCVIFIFVLLYIYNWHIALQNYFFFAVWSLAGVYFIGMVATPRPHMLGLCFFTVYLLILESIEKQKAAWYYAVPLLSCFWANCHGGSANLVYILPIFYLLAGWRKISFLRIDTKEYTEKQKRAYGYCIFSGIAGTCINPRGVELLLYPYTYSNDSTKYIQEWMAPNVKSNMDIFIFITAIVMIWILTEKKLDGKMMMMVGAFLVLTLASIRFVAWLYIASSIFLFSYVKRFPRLRKRDSIHIFFMVFSIVLIVAVPFKKMRKEIHMELVEVIKGETYQKMYNSYQLGDCLIYEGIEVFFDGRADLYYPDGSLEDGFRLDFPDSLDKERKKIIKKYGFDFFVTKAGSGLDDFLKRHGKKYEMLYRDKKSVVYKKKAFAPKNNERNQ